MASCLITVVWGKTYHGYAKGLFSSAQSYFPGDTLKLEAREGWPAATLYRYHVLLEADLADYDYIYLCDADMRFEQMVGVEIYAEIVATQHPGYVGRKDLPYEDRPESTAFVASGTTYYAGGFVGGEREAFLTLARKMVFSIDEDDEHGILARWHDESHLNRILADSPPSVTLSPSYCYPDDPTGYPWLRSYERKLVALDKTPKERIGR